MNNKIKFNEIYCKKIVKLQSKLISPVQVGQGFDFVFPLSQEEEEQEEPSPKYTRTKCTTDLGVGTNILLTKLRPHPPSQGWSPTIPRIVTHPTQQGV